MPNLSEISNGTKLLLGAGILLLIDTFLPWQKVTAEFGGVEIASASRSGWSGIGIVMGLVLILLLAWVVLQVLNVKLNFELPITEAWLTLGLGVAVLGLAVIKLITILGEASTIWSYIGVALAALIAFGAWLRAQELGGIAQPAAATGGMSSTMEDESGMAPGAGTAATTGPTTPSTTPMEPAAPTTPPPPAAPTTPMAPAEPAAPRTPTAPADTMPEDRDEDERPPETRSTP